MTGEQISQLVDSVKADLCPVCVSTCNEEQLRERLDADGTCNGWNPQRKWLDQQPPLWWVEGTVTP
ncbi:MAG: hypothetical protein RDU41_06340 [Clostridia bacterium]|nr:hypothetical protein [Clostridia bacterium]